MARQELIILTIKIDHSKKEFNVILECIVTMGLVISAGFKIIADTLANIHEL